MVSAKRKPIGFLNSYTNRGSVEIGVLLPLNRARHHFPAFEANVGVFHLRR